MAKYENGNSTRDQILSTAQELFFEKGISKTSIEDVARQAHVARNSIQYHFPTKKAIGYGINDRILDSLFKVAGASAKLESFKWPISSYVFWYRFFRDEPFRRFYVSDIGRMKFEPQDIGMIYKMLKSSYNIQQTLEEFTAQHAFACRTFNNVLYDLAVYCLEKLMMDPPDVNTNYIWATEQEIGISSRIFGIPDKRISALLEGGKIVMEALDIETLTADTE